MSLTGYQARGLPRRLRQGAACFIAGLIGSTTLAADRYPALAPEEALRHFQLEAGLRIELVAAEPLVIDPVAFAFDDRGRLFVAEGRGYPDPIEGGHGTTLGRIVTLEDADGDGRMDRRREFATGLGYVNGLQPWRGGWLVTAAPDILYLKDEDGDGVADVRRVVLTGFDATKTAQLRVSHPTLGLDGYVYVTSGLNGGKVVSPEHPDRPAVTFSLRDGRFHPDTLIFENTGGRAQFGLAFDPFGRRFITSNRHPVLQVMLEPWHLGRNPQYAFSDTTQEVSKVEAEARVSPVSRAVVSADFIPRLMGTPHTGTFTSASGLLVFGGTGLRSEHRGNVFICESAQNLIQRQVLSPAGASFRAERPYQKREFLASTDVWFRPVFLGHGPDGGLYVADMYRREIDHPRYVPEESRGGLDFERGKDRGRIYRIVRDERTEGASPFSQLRSGAEQNRETLIAGLLSDDEWWRERSHRLLLERGEPAADAALADVVRQAPLAESRARAFALLESRAGVSDELRIRGLTDRHPGVRELAVQGLAGGRVGSTGVRSALLARTEDEDARVRFVTALALGDLPGSDVLTALAGIAVRDGEDRWARGAVLSGIAGRTEAFFAALQPRWSANPRSAALVLGELGRLLGATGDAEASRAFLAAVAQPATGFRVQGAAILGLFEGWNGREKVRGAPAADWKASLHRQAGPPDTLVTFLQGVGLVVVDAARAADERSTAIALLGFADFETARDPLTRVLDARQPPELQLLAVRALERIGDPRGGRLLLARDKWPHYTPRLREAVLATMTAKPPLLEVLFAAIREGIVAAPEVSSVRRAQLLRHANADVKRQANELFGGLEGGDRMQVYRNYRDALGGVRDVAAGRTVFTRACSACHTHEGVGGQVGPDLTGVRNQPADALLLHILVPNYEVSPHYQALTVTLQDGRSVSGWLAAESEASLSLRTAFGAEETVLRSAIASLSASGVSLMPDGLEQAITPAEMADLIAFLKHTP